MYTLNNAFLLEWWGPISLSALPACMGPPSLFLPVAFIWSPPLFLPQYNLHKQILFPPSRRDFGLSKQKKERETFSRIKQHEKNPRRIMWCMIVWESHYFVGVRKLCLQKSWNKSLRYQCQWYISLLMSVAFFSRRILSVFRVLFKMLLRLERKQKYQQKKLFFFFSFCAEYLQGNGNVNYLYFCLMQT